MQAQEVSCCTLDRDLEKPLACINEFFVKMSQAG